MSNNKQLTQCIKLIEKFFNAEFEPVLSEGHLQFDLATFLRLQYGNDKIFVECPVFCQYFPNKYYTRRSADIVVLVDHSFMVIELKYKTTEARINRPSNNISLINQGGQTQGKKKFIEDIIKISDTKLGLPNNHIIEGDWEYIGGIAAFCTNDASYHDWKGKAWGQSSKPNDEIIGHEVNWIELFKTSLKEGVISHNVHNSFYIQYHPWKGLEKWSFKYTLAINSRGKI